LLKSINTGYYKLSEALQGMVSIIENPDFGNIEDFVSWEQVHRSILFNTGLSANTTYWYKVSAVDSTGEGLQSTTVSESTLINK
jgi:hypothetical protein